MGRIQSAAVGCATVVCTVAWQQRMSRRTTGKSHCRYTTPFAPKMLTDAVAARTKELVLAKQDEYGYKSATLSIPAAVSLV